MPIRRLFAVSALILIGSILVACGSDDEEASPTASIVPTEAPTITEPVATAEPTEPDASPVASPASPVASPVSEIATPVADATIVGEEATAESVESTPVSDMTVSPVALTDDVDAESEPTMVGIAGTLTLDGRVQQDYTLSEDGCVGLGEWRQLKPGTQVIVRDATGTVVDIATLEGQDSSDTCSWIFIIEVPDADYFSVSIPMVTEVWFDQDDSAVKSGELELFVP